MPVVTGNDAVSDGLLEEVDRVLVVDLGAGVTAIVEEAAGVGGMGHVGRSWAEGKGAGKLG